MPTAENILADTFGTLADLIAAHAAAQPNKIAIALDDDALTYAELDALMDRIAAAMQRDGVARGEAVAMVAATSLNYAASFLGALRAGAAAAPMAPSSTAAQLAAMIGDSGSRLLFLDGEAAATLAGTDLSAGHPAHRLR